MAFDPNRRSFLSLLASAWFAASAPAWAASQELVVIVNAKSKTRSLSAPDLSRIFRMVKMSWPSGERVLAFNLPARHPVRVRFDRTVLHMDPDEVGRYWIDQKVRGGKHPPRPIPSATLVATIVSKLDGAVGYVPPSEVRPGLRVVARLRDGRVEPV